MSSQPELILYGYWRSSASYRVRLALAWKKLPYEQRPVHLLNQGGEHTHPDYLAINPQGLLPTLIHSGTVITQSLAIIEYLEETFPAPALLPRDRALRAHARAIALAIAAEIAPLQNLRVLQAIEALAGTDPEAKTAWARRWIDSGLSAVEAMLGQHHADAHRARYCIGDEPTIADCCLLPQAYNAQRFGCDLERWPTIRAICSNLGHNEAIESAKPENQPDAPKNND